MKIRLIFIAILAVAAYAFWSYANTTLAKERCLSGGGQWVQEDKRCSI